MKTVFTSPYFVSSFRLVQIDLVLVSMYYSSLMIKYSFFAGRFGE